MKKIIPMLFCSVLLLAANTALADSLNSCSNATGSTQNENFDVTTSLTADTNVAGKTTQVVRSGDIHMNAVCPQEAGNSNTYTYRSYVSNYPVVETSGNWKYLQLNGYLEGALKVTDSVAGDIYAPANYAKMGGDSCVPKGCNFPVSDSNITLQIKIAKPFVGNVTIPQTNLFNVYINRTNTSSFGTPVYTISFSGSITVPQSCEVNSNQVITIDFGTLSSGNFKTKGQKPAGFMPVTEQVPVKCSGGVTEMASLSFRFQGTADSNEPTAIATDNKDIAVQFTDNSGNVIIPNTGTIPFQLQNYIATVPFSVAPISATGNKPLQGVFHAQAYIVVDFD
ncbi:fimbrial protein [Kluyvera intermedia]|uniref:fimbrial protein n=1 Tax=Kluyvera intermedia TaxID=61648 RepID=UPI001F389B44|nr:fimbrial protein [Kluyvera intermedia]MCE9890314.1 fimbrial protein [Kluyvera intermedia]